MSDCVDQHGGHDDDQDSGAVPGTILLDVLTGSPTVPDTAAAESGSQPSPGLELPPGELAGRILLGSASYAINNVAAIFDIVTMDSAEEMPSWFTPGMPGPPAELSWLDLALDFIGWAMTMVASYGWATWEAQDWVYWSVQTIPQAFNFGYMFRTDGTGHRQAIRDTVSGVITLIDRPPGPLAGRPGPHYAMTEPPQRHAADRGSCPGDWPPSM